MSIFAYFTKIWPKIEISNQELNKVINGYLFFYVSKELNPEQNDYLFQQLSISKVAIFDHYKSIESNQEEQFLIIVFENTIICIKSQSINLLHPLFSSNSNLKFCFLSNAESIFDQNSNIKYSRSNFDKYLKNDINNINQKICIRTSHNSRTMNIIETILSSIFGYLIEKCYIKLFQNKKIKTFENKKSPL